MCLIALFLDRCHVLVLAFQAYIFPPQCSTYWQQMQLNRVCDYAGEDIDDPVAADGDEMEEDAEATADLATGEDEVENVVANVSYALR
jgi:hypothetical protein